ncbi:competence/damage-inducible protein A [Ruminococcaceae bacterium OttesenSCG-928-A16]|nr:competence/damage-inducible protein A [Ruminococcaceae bacterium OttesenSCG-928-A16]
MRAEIISVGTELLLGDIVNTNAQFLARELAQLGFGVYYQTVVGDNPARLEEVVEQAKQRSEVLLLTGGLGPTDDDLTKQTVARLFGDTLVLDEVELEGIRQFFKNRSLPMGENNIKQAMLPKNGKKLLNPNGTAPGAMFKDDDKYAFLMPGPPREMKPMFLNEVRPILLKMQDATIHSINLRTFGIGESDLENRIRPLLMGENPTAALYAETGEVHVRVTARAKTTQQAAALCNELAEKLKQELGDLVYSENGDELEATLVHLLARKSESLATAESCTGGLLSKRITDVPGASEVFGFGACTYTNQMKQKVLGVNPQTLQQHGAVSSQTAAEMAFGIANFAGAQFGVGITGIAGPDGGTPEKPVGLVYVAVCHGSTVAVKKLQLGGRGRQVVRRLATQHALDMVRRMALGLPIEKAGYFEKGTPADLQEV